MAGEIATEVEKVAQSFAEFQVRLLWQLLSAGSLQFSVQRAVGSSDFSLQLRNPMYVSYRCGKCGGSVSGSTSNCPHCGIVLLSEGPSPKREPDWYELLFVCLGLLATVALAIGGCIYLQPPEAPKAEPRLQWVFEVFTTPFEPEKTVAAIETVESIEKASNFYMNGRIYMAVVPEREASDEQELLAIKDNVIKKFEALGLNVMETRTVVP